MVDFRKVAVAVAVAILFAFFVGLLIDLVYESPKYENFCKLNLERAKAIPVPAMPVPSSGCSFEYGEEYNKCLNDKGQPIFDYNESGCQIYKKCDFCSLNFNEASKSYNRNVFLLVGIIGLIAIFIGTLLKIDFLGTGLMFGGILLLIYGTVRFFGDADKLLRVIIIFAELLIVIWIGYIKLYKNGGKSRRY